MKNATTARKRYNALVKTEEYRNSDDSTLCLRLRSEGFENVRTERGSIKFK